MKTISAKQMALRHIKQYQHDIHSIDELPYIVTVSDLIEDKSITQLNRELNLHSINKQK